MTDLYFRPTLEETLHSLRNRIDQQRKTIAALQARADKAEADLRTAREGFARYQAGASDRHIRDIGKITKLQAEVERLTQTIMGVSGENRATLLANLMRYWTPEGKRMLAEKLVGCECPKNEAELAQSRAEVERLREALKDLVDATGWIDTEHAEHAEPPVGTIDVIAQAHAALAHSEPGSRQG